MDETAQFHNALQCYRAKDYAGAEKHCREILSANPRHAYSIHMMAAIGYDIGNYDAAEGLARLALSENDTVSDFYYTLGMIKQKQKKLEDALILLQKAVDLAPQSHHALVDLASLCKDIGAVKRDNNLIEGALSFYARALAIRADEDIYYGIAHAHFLKGDYYNSIEAGKAGLKRYPESVKIMQAISATYNFTQQYEEALDLCERIRTLEPDNHVNYANMSNTLKSLGRLEEAITYQKMALEGLPQEAWVYSNLLLAMVYSPSTTPEELADVSRNFGAHVADPLMRTRLFKNNKRANRKLRIGYLSPDFRDHAIRYFLAPIYHCNKDEFEIYAYSKNELDDKITEKIKNYFHHWRDIKYYKDDRTADIIEEDKIDILVDLAGHTSHNGLLIFARKPAPIQVTWLGHPATSGMKAMDYRISDPYAEPPGMTEHLNTETLWRLPDIFCAYSPHENSPDVIDHPPFEDNGHITFGCFNNFTKVTDEVLETWSQIMSQVPNSKILLEIFGIWSPQIKGEISDRLARFLPMDRVIMEPRSKANQFVLYNKIDIALDPFPCVGGTTSMDTLWMGVPFVTLAGRQFLSRMGVTILTNTGIPELIAQAKEEYIKIAVDLAQDNEKLRMVRKGLRQRFAASPVMDQEKFARNMETAYRAMWTKWVERA